ncbi:ABC transporter substrate-binding protein [Microbacterium sp. NPDC055683]
MPSFRLLLAPTALAASALLLASCAAAETTAEGAATETAPAALAVQNRWVNNVQFAGGFVAEASGFYEDEQLTVTSTPGGPGVNVEPLVVQGTADIGLSNPANTAHAVAEGAPLTIVGAVYQTSPSAVISLADDPIEAPADLVGRSVGVTAASTASFTAWLASAGVDAADVEIVPIQGDAAPLVSGQVDAISGLATNQGVALELAGEQPVVLELSDFGRDSMDLTYTVATADLDDPERRSAIVRYLAAEIRGWLSVIDDPQAAVDVVLEGPGADLDLDAVQQLEQATLTNDYIRPSDDVQVLAMPEELVDKTLATLAQDGVDADASLFDGSLVDEAYALIEAGE